MLLSKLPLYLMAPQAVVLAADVVLLPVPGREDAPGSLPIGSEPPYGSVLVQNQTGCFRIVATRWKAREGHGENAGSSGGPTEPSFAPAFLDGDLEELASELDDTSRWRLLNFLLGFCRKAFGLSENEHFAIACRKLAKIVAPNAGIAEPIASVTPAWMVLRGPTLSPEASCFVLGTRGVHRARTVKLPGLGDHHAVERIGEADFLLAMSELPQRWTVASPPGQIRDLIPPQPEFAALRAACLRALVPVCDTVAQALRHRLLLSPSAPIRHEDPRQPIAGGLDAALSDGEGYVFLRGWLRDPMHLIQSIALQTPCGDVELAPEALFRHRRPDVEKRFVKGLFSHADGRCGFVARIEDPSSGACPQPTLQLRLRSGGRLMLRPLLRQPDASMCRAAVLTSVLPADVTAEMLDSCIAPAAAAFHRRVLADRSAPELIEIGHPQNNPSITIIVPLYRNLSFLRFQIAALAADPAFHNAELIAVLDSPEQRQEAEHLLRGLHAMHDRSIRLLVLPRNLGYSAANNEGARYARGRTLLLLNSDVVPSANGWLSQLQAALEAPDVGAVGPKLLFDDESIQHAGLYFRRGDDAVWLNAHYHKGMPRRWGDASTARDVPGVTGAALLVRRDLFESVGGICEDYIVGDYEDSDFCLRLRQRGKRILYVPSVELFHFERRSIDMHKGYAGTLACQYNRRLHHRRWDNAIAALMARPEFQPARCGDRA